MAQRIVEDRDRKGNFKTWDHVVERVRGMGVGKVMQLRDAGFSLTARVRRKRPDANARVPAGATATSSSATQSAGRVQTSNQRHAQSDATTLPVPSTTLMSEAAAGLVGLAALL